MADEERRRVERGAAMVYPAEILADSALGRADLPTFGAWMKTLLRFWSEGIASLSADEGGWARLWGCGQEEAARILGEFKELGIAELKRREGGVTVACRRLVRREQARLSNLDRARRRRARGPNSGRATSKRAGAMAEEDAAARGGGEGRERGAPERSGGGDASERSDAAAKSERLKKLWWLWKRGELKELTFRKDGAKARVIEASPDGITVEYAPARLGGRTCRSLLGPEEVELVQEDGEPERQVHS